MAQPEVRFAAIGIVTDRTFYEIRVEPVNGAPALVNVWVHSDGNPTQGRQGISGIAVVAYLELFGVMANDADHLLWMVGRNRVTSARK